MRLRGEGGTLTFEVRDDGAGFDVTATRNGAGLTNTSDCVDALGGSVEFVSHPADGTCVRGALPARGLVGARSLLSRRPTL